MSQQSRPFNYSLRVSSRARNVRIAIKPYLGLEVVIPKRFPKKKIPRILQQHEAWIIKQLEKHQHSLQDTELPTRLSLPLLQLDWQIAYDSTNKSRLLENGDTLTVSYSSKEQAIKMLRNWLRNKAKQALPTMLHDIADEFNFQFNKTSIRSQKSRWGSCSSSGTISLNDQLLFMPEETVRYLMIHELCHTLHMNHSLKFWRLVETCCPNYKQHDQVLSKGREQVPDWFSHSLFS